MKVDSNRNRIGSRRCARGQASKSLAEQGGLIASHFMLYLTLLNEKFPLPSGTVITLLQWTDEG